MTKQTKVIIGLLSFVAIATIGIIIVKTHKTLSDDIQFDEPSDDVTHSARS